MLRRNDISPFAAFPAFSLQIGERGRPFLLVFRAAAPPVANDEDGYPL